MIADHIDRGPYEMPTIRTMLVEHDEQIADGSFSLGSMVPFPHDSAVLVQRACASREQDRPRWGDGCVVVRNVREAI